MWVDYKPAIQTGFARLKVRWGLLSLREQKTALVGGLVAGGLLLYGLIWLPSVAAVDALRDRLSNGQQTLQVMMRANTAISAAAKQQGLKIPGSLVALLGDVQTSMRSAHLDQSLASLKQTSNDTIEIEFKQVDFEQWLAWLTQLTQHEALVVSQVSAVRQATPGMVAVTLWVKR